MLIQIKTRWDDSVIFEGEFESLLLAVEEAVRKNVNLYGANLYGANLYGASLEGASLVGADLDGANLYGASLKGASLVGASLVGADLVGASLKGARLDGARLDPIRVDLWDVLLRAPGEVEALRQALLDGKVDGSTYTGVCACLVGTIANARRCDTDALGSLVPDANRPAERWFLAIGPGDTPDKSSVAKLTLEWVDQFLALAAAWKSVGSEAGQ